MAVSAQMELTFIPADSESQLSEEKSQLSKEKSQLSKEKTFSEIEVEDKELGAFKRYVQQKTDNEFRNNTIEKVLKLFSRYRYEYSFNRRNIADLFSISENGASAFLKKFIDKGIIGKRKKDEYYFINPEG